MPKIAEDQMPSLKKETKGSPDCSGPSVSINLATSSWGPIPQLQKVFLAHGKKVSRAHDMKNTQSNLSLLCPLFLHNQVRIFPLLASISERQQGRAGAALLWSCCPAPSRVWLLPRARSTRAGPQCLKQPQELFYNVGNAKGKFTRTEKLSVAVCLVCGHTSQ